MELVFNSATVKLYHGDAAKLVAIPDKSVAMILTDAPYGVDYQSHHRAEMFDPILADQYYPWQLMNDFLFEAIRVLTSSSAIYLFTTWSKFHLLTNQVKEFFVLGNPIVWVKDNWSGGSLEADWANRIELIIYAYKKGHKLRGARPNNLLLFKRVAGNELIHPAQKPVPLLEYIITKSSDPGDTVLDPFCGSGSTLLAAIATGRKAIGIDIDRAQLGKAIERIKSATSPFPGTEDPMLKPSNFTPSWWGGVDAGEHF